MLKYLSQDQGQYTKAMFDFEFRMLTFGSYSLVKIIK